MATRFLTRSLLTATKKPLSSALLRSYSSRPLAPPTCSLSSVSPLWIRSPIAAAANVQRFYPAAITVRGFATPKRSSYDIPVAGCDFKHWKVLMKRPEGGLTREEIIDSYIKTLAMVVGSEEEARMKIYSVSAKVFFYFGAAVSEELSKKISALPGVSCVFPDAYFDPEEESYEGEPFINGQPVPYDPKYYEIMPFGKPPKGPRKFCRSRSVEGRKKYTKNSEFQSPMEIQNRPDMGGVRANSA